MSSDSLIALPPGLKPGHASAISDEEFDVVVEPSRGWSELRLAEVWQYRELLFFLAWRDIKIRYKQTLLGAAWAIIQPVATALAFAFLLGRVAKLPSEGVPYPIFTLAGLLPWTLFATALAQSSNSLISNQNLISKVYFPRLILPLAATISGLVDFAFALLVLVGFMVFFRVMPTAAVLLVPVFILLALLAAVAVGLWLSALNVKFRDVRHMIPFLVQFGLIVTPVAYSSTVFTGRARILYALNPMAGVVEGFRWALVGTTMPAITPILLSFGVVAVLLLGGLFYFRRMERAFADLV